MNDRAALRDALRLSLGPAGPALDVAGVLLGLFLLVPIVIIFPVSLTSDFFLTWPPHLASTRWFEAFFDSPVWTDALARSIRIALPVALIATVLGTLSALGLAYARRGRRLLQTLFIAPMVLPIITYALGLYDVAQRFDMTGSALPVIVGQAMLATPIVFIVVSAGLAGRDPLLPRAAASLGASAASVLGGSSCRCCASRSSPGADRGRLLVRRDHRSVISSRRPARARCLCRSSARPARPAAGPSPRRAWS